MPTEAQAAYRTLYDTLRRRIAEGDWNVGDLIPSISDLQEKYGINSPGTVRQAQQMLVAEGVLRTVSGKGAFVVALPSDEQCFSPQAAAAAKIREALVLLAQAADLLDPRP